MPVKKLTAKWTLWAKCLMHPHWEQVWCSTRIVTGLKTFWTQSMPLTGHSLHTDQRMNYGKMALVGMIGLSEVERYRWREEARDSLEHGRADVELEWVCKYEA